MPELSGLTQAEERVVRRKAILEAVNIVFAGEDAAHKEYSAAALGSLRAALVDWLREVQWPVDRPRHPLAL